MRLKPAGIIAIILVIAVLAYLALKPRLADAGNSSNTNTAQTTAPASSNADTASNNSATTPSSKATTASRSFNYTPEKPVNGVLRGVVEVGATGFNSFVINMDDQKRWEIVSKDFGESLAYEGLATTDDIRAGLKKYLSQMFDKGVSGKNMHFVISSGAQKEPKTAVISSELQKMGYVVNKVTADEEAKYGFMATVPASFRDNSFLVDVGSGNTKISYSDNGTVKTMELPGAKYYEKGTPDDQVYNDVKAGVDKIPESKRNVGFIIGGVPYTLANQNRNGQERYTVLYAPGTYTAADKKMGSGLNIYKAIADATNTDTFVFDWDANFTIGFLLSLNTK